MVDKLGGQFFMLIKCHLNNLSGVLGTSVPPVSLGFLGKICPVAAGGTEVLPFLPRYKQYLQASTVLRFQKETTCHMSAIGFREGYDGKNGFPLASINRTNKPLAPNSAPLGKPLKTERLHQRVNRHKTVTSGIQGYQ